MDKAFVTVSAWHKLALEGLAKGQCIPVSFQVNGWSMEPFIRYQRDEVTIHPVTRPLKCGDIVLFEAKRLGGDYVLHGIWKMENGLITTLGYHCLYPDAPLPEEKILGVAVAVRRGEHVIPMESRYWKALTSLWMRLYPLRKCIMLGKVLGKRGLGWLWRRIKKNKSA